MIWVVTVLKDKASLQTQVNAGKSSINFDNDKNLSFDVSGVVKDLKVSFPLIEMVKVLEMRNQTVKPLGFEEARENICAIGEDEDLPINL